MPLRPSAEPLHEPRPVEWRRDEYSVSTDPARLDLNVIVRELAEAYWARGRSRERIERSLRWSLNFGVYQGRRQVGFARAVTDRATFAYIADVFIVPAARGQGLGVWLMECIAAHPELQGLRRWLLATRDAHGLYEKSGFGPLRQPERWLERLAEPSEPTEGVPANVSPTGQSDPAP
ncbi:MAG: GNAT family N-acetyltransferase [Candidatus Limnocylindrales bacterium]